MKRHAATIILVLVAIALGVWLWTDRDRVTEGERKRRENSVFNAWRREELSRIVIAHDGETIVLERDAKKDAAWRMTSPREERADVGAVERLVTTLEFANVARKASPGTTGTGLETPRANGEIRMGALVTRFALGGPSPRPEGSSYFRIGDEAPVVVSRELATALLAPSDTYRDRTVVPYLSLDLARFEVKHAEGGFVLERANELSFRVADRGVLASRRAIDAVWAALAEMRAEAFPKDADADRLTAAPKLTIAMTPKDPSKPPAEIVLGDACPGHPADIVVLRRTPTRVAACAPKGVVDALLAKPDALVSRRPFSVAMDEIEELRLERIAPSDAGAGAPAAIELARKGSGFHLRAPEDRDLDEAEADAATELVARVADSDAVSVARGGAPFTAAARARVRFAEREEVVEVGAVENGRATLRRLADDARLEVTAAVARRFVPRATSYRPRRVLAGESRRVVRVLLRCGVAQELVDSGEGFRLIEPKGYETDGTIVQLVDAVVRGRIDLWVADEDDGTFGLTPNACQMVLGFEGGNAPVTITLGAEGDAGVYGKVDTRPGVFVAPLSLRELMGRIFVSRASLRTEASAIERVRATSGGRPTTLDDGTLRSVASGLLADQVVALGRAAVTALPPADVVLEVTRSEVGAPRRIVCRPADAAGKRRCTASDVDAVFLVSSTRLAALDPARAGADGGADAGADPGADASADAARSP